RLQRDGHPDDICVPVAFEGRIARGTWRVIPVGVTFQFRGRSLEFAGLVNKRGSHQQVWTIEIGSGEITNTLRPPRNPPDSDFAVFDGVPTPPYLRKYLKNLWYFGRGGLAPALLMHLGVLNKYPEFLDC